MNDLHARIDALSAEQRALLELRLRSKSARTHHRNREPFFFDRSGHRLWACLHQAKNSAPLCVVMVNPLVSEALHTHRCYARLAELLAQSGVPALRFDLFATGDSDGEDLAASVAEWQQDVVAAVAEARERTGADQVVLVGLRFGATLALSSCAWLTAVRALCLWNPALDGREHIRELAVAHHQHLRHRPLKKRMSAVAGGSELLGFRVSAELLDEVEEFRESELAGPPPPDVLVAESHPFSGRDQLAEALRKAGSKVKLISKLSSPTWERRANRQVVPLEMLKSMAHWIEELDS